MPADLRKIKPNPDNPRTIRDSEFFALVDSIKQDPQFLDKRPIVHAGGIILGGNMRYRAIKEAMTDETFRAAIGAKNKNTVPDAWIQDASDWTPEQRRRFVIVDNAPQGMAGDWDWDALANQWDDLPLADWGMVPEISATDLVLEDENTKNKAPSGVVIKAEIPQKVYLMMETEIREKIEALISEYGGEVTFP